MKNESDVLDKNNTRSQNTSNHQNQTNENLRTSEERFRLLSEAAEEGIAIHDNGVIIEANQALARMFGYDLSEIIGKYVKNGATRESWKVISDNIASGYDKFYEITAVRKDGSTFICSMVGKPCKYKDRTLRAATFRDVTERKEAEEALRQSNENFRRSLDDSPLGVRISTIEGKTLYANRAILDIYGYDNIEELENMPIHERYTPETYAEFKIRKQKRSRGESGPTEYEVSIVRKSGEVRNLYVFRKQIFWNGEKQSQVIYQDITLRRQAEKKLNETLKSLRNAIKTTIQVLGTVSDARDPYTAGHQRRVADLARTIAAEMKLPHDKIEAIRMAAAIHDIGKISVPSEILCKASILTELEFSLIKNHSQYSYEIMKDVESPWPLADIVHQHHERVDGSGYPQGLKDTNILIEARILAVADVVDAMISYRPYRPALELECALTEIENNKGILYDNVVADACLRLFRKKGYQLS